MKRGGRPTKNKRRRARQKLEGCCIFAARRFSSNCATASSSTVRGAHDFALPEASSKTEHVQNVCWVYKWVSYRTFRCTKVSNFRTSDISRYRTLNISNNRLLYRKRFALHPATSSNVCIYPSIELSEHLIYPSIELSIYRSIELSNIQQSMCRIERVSPSIPSLASPHFQRWRSTKNFKRWTDHESPGLDGVRTNVTHHTLQTITWKRVRQITQIVPDHRTTWLQSRPHAYNHMTTPCMSIIAAETCNWHTSLRSCTTVQLEVFFSTPEYVFLFWGLVRIN